MTHAILIEQLRTMVNLSRINGWTKVSELCDEAADALEECDTLIDLYGGARLTAVSPEVNHLAGWENVQQPTSGATGVIRVLPPITAEQSRRGA